MRSAPKSIRVDQDLLDWFNDYYPWSGSLPGFVNACLLHLKSEVGDRPAPHTILPQVVRKVVESGDF